MKGLRFSVLLSLLLSGTIFSGLSCVSQDIFDKVNPDLGRYSARLVSFIDTNPALAVLSGTIDVVNALDESKVTVYRLYWGSGPATKLGGMITSTPATGAPVSFTFTNTPMPAGATHLLVYSYNPSDGELDMPGSCAIVDYPSAGVFVDAALGNDTTGLGTRDQPYQTIPHAITNHGTFTAIHVAEGNYNVATPIDLVDGVSLYGGYQSGTWVRDSAVYFTAINDSTAAGGVISNPNACISAPAGITNITVVDGFTINGGGGAYSSGIRCVNGGSPIIQNCVIHGGNGTTQSSGILIYNTSSPVIHHNTINGGNSTAVSYGIHSFTNNDNVSIFSNTINAGNGPTRRGIRLLDSTALPGTYIGSNTINCGNGPAAGVMAIYCENARATVQWNIVNGGTDVTATYGIYIVNSPEVIIENNQIDALGDPATGNTSYGVYVMNSASVPLRNNTIVGGVRPPVAGSFSYGVYLMNVPAPVIEDNVINGGSGALSTYGFYAENANVSLRIINNRINGGGGVNLSTGILLQAAQPTTFICNNAVDGGTALDSRGIHTRGGCNDLKILNNTVKGGGPATNTAYGLFLDVSPGFSIYNNLFFAEGMGTRYGVFENDGGSTPVHVSNNNFFNCSVLYRDSINNDLSAGLIALLQLHSGAVAVGNVEVALTLNAEFRLITVFPPAVTQGGINLFALFGADFPNITGDPIDRDGALRTDPWSMGAYEY